MLLVRSYKQVMYGNWRLWWCLYEELFIFRRMCWKVLAHPASLAERLMFCRCHFLLSSFFKDHLGDKLSENVLDRFAPNFQDRYTVTHVNRIGENWHTPPSFCALAFHNGREDRNMDVRVNADDAPSTSDKNLVNFGLVTREFCRRVYAGPMLSFLVWKCSSGPILKTL